MIRFADVTAHAAPYSLTRISLELGAGVHAVLGTPMDGPSLLLAVAAGWVRPRSGQVLALGAAPADARRQIAYVPSDPRLPPALRIAEVLEVAAEVRGERATSARSRLEAFGLASLADRFTQTLTSSEARAVLLVEAVTSNARALLVDEPLVDVDPRATGPLLAMMRQRAAGGATVVVATSSPRDAFELSGDQWILSFGRLAGVVRVADAALLPVGGRSTLQVVAHDAKALLGALAGEPHFSTVALDRDVLVLAGRDPAAMAAAVARAALASGVELESMHVQAPDLAELRAGAARARPASLRPAGADPAQTPAGAP